MGRRWCGISVRIYNFVERVKGSSFGGPFLCQELFHQKSGFEVELQSLVLRFVGLGVVSGGAGGTESAE